MAVVEQRRIRGETNEEAKKKERRAAHAQSRVAGALKIVPITLFSSLAGPAE